MRLRSAQQRHGAIGDLAGVPTVTSPLCLSNTGRSFCSAARFCSARTPLSAASSAWYFGGAVIGAISAASGRLLRAAAR